MTAELHEGIPSKDEIRAALARIVNSNAFTRAERARALLTYIVTEDIAGRGGLLKGYSIAQDVFQKDKNFDPATDAVVRVQAGRLRENLENYYRSEGKDDLVEIRVPVGTYIPGYSFRAERLNSSQFAGDEKQKDHTATPSNGLDGSVDRFGGKKGRRQKPTVRADVPVSPFVISTIRRIWITLTAVLLLLGLIIYLIWNINVADDRGALPETSLQRISDAPSVETLPALNIMLSNSSGGATGDAWVRRLNNAASRFSFVRLVRVVGEQESPLNTELAFNMYVSVRADESADIELVHLRDQSIIWSGNIVASVPTGDANKYTMPGAMTTILGPAGKIYAHMASSGELTGLANCLWSTNTFNQREDYETYQQAINCHEKILEKEEAVSLSYSDMAILLIEGIERKYAYPEGTVPADAMRMSQKAFETASTAESYRALGAVLSHNKDFVGAESANRKAYEFNPFDLNMAAYYAGSLLQSHAFDEAKLIMTHVMSNARVENTRWSYTLFISAFLDGDMTTAINSTGNLAGSDRPHYLAARLISAQLSGNDPLRVELADKLRSVSSDLTKDPLDYYTRWYGSDAARTIVHALSEAGLATR